ncbi:hypothetical protein NIES593_21570 [Hydrococcus rivularis NIES-593]|uniref:Uncharacterized protein n=1 Tax=Hydrococcus rivularis NIES-593 TaxID=1921803 RepID=A0A1U7H879_9CYAN|nr:hypothetical protein [Hydrococcus rivularis]OKH18995.1 hypothetical protein NIES593_21570 [Hydrococcus rivularis NIES-593]
MKKLIFSLLTLTALGMVSLPAHADGDSAVIQDSRQTTTQTGVGNYSGQTTIQKNRVERSGYRNGSTGDVQTSDQLSDQYGVGNSSQQRVRQENVRQERGSRHRSCDWGCDY